MCVSREMAGCLDVASTNTVMVTKNTGRATEESRKVRAIFPALPYININGVSQFNSSREHVTNHL